MDWLHCISYFFGEPRDLDLVGWALLSPGLVLFLYGSDHIRDRTGIVSLVGSILLLVAFFRWATRKKDEALIDLRLFKGKIFSASAVTQFLSNGISFAGQMLIPIFLIRVGGRSPGTTGLLLAPLGFGMMCGYPFVGTCVKCFGNRKVSAAYSSHSDDDLCDFSGVEIGICARPRWDARRFYSGLCSPMRFPWSFDRRGAETSSYDCGLRFAQEAGFTLIGIQSTLPEFTH
jgi:hypothetical protein